MMFLFVLRIIQRWYYTIFFPIMMNPYTYLMLLLWMIVAGATTYLFLYVVDRDRMQYMYKNLGIAMVQAAALGLLAATMVISLYNLSVALTVDSDFFSSYQKTQAQQLATHMPWQTGISELIEQRILTILFLLCSTQLSLQFVGAQVYYLQDDDIRNKYFGLLVLGAGICYLICVFLGYV